MNLCIVVPTMSRKSTGLKYFISTLEKNKEIYNNVSFYIYINENDEQYMNENLYLTNVKYNIIRRENHDSKLNIFKNDKYSYWRSHLCLDFVYSMKKSMELNKESKYFMWLEDDNLLHPNFLNIWNNFNKDNFIWTSNSHGAICLIFERSYLENNVLISVENNCLDDIPLDWMYRFFVQPTDIPIKLAFHIGVESSRENCIRDQNEWDQYNRLV